MYYRYNRYNEKIAVEKYTCGSCRHYEFEREDQTNYCNHYSCYCNHTEHCSSNWEMADDVDGGSSCFLTTACCEYKGLGDDCEILTKMRKFRDEQLIGNPKGYALVQEYYRVAPAILRQIDLSEEKNSILESIYQQVLEIVMLLDCEAFEDAKSKYVCMVENLRAQLKV